MSRAQILLLVLPVVLLRGSIELATKWWATMPAPTARRLTPEDSTALSEEDSTAPPDIDSTASPPEDTTSSVAMSCPAPTAPNGNFTLTSGSGTTAVWMLTCKPGFRPDPRIGSLFFCSETLDVFPTPVCQADSGCRGEDAVPNGVFAQGTTCSPVLDEGASCVAVCGTPAVAYGAFVCSLGQMLHTSHCVDPSDELSYETVEKVAATIAVELDKPPTEVAILNAISAALNLPEDNVHSIRWVAAQRRLQGFLGLAVRRLQTAYIISYEVIVPINSSGDVVARSATGLVLEQSSASRALKASLRDLGFVVGAVRQVVAPRSFQQVVVKSVDGKFLPIQTLTPTIPAEPTISNTDGGSGGDAGRIVGGIIGGLVGTFIVGLCCWWFVFARRKNVEV